MTSITDRINALTQPMPGMVDRAAVLDIVRDAIAFETEPHGDDRAHPEEEGARLMWATLDTALRVIALGAAKGNLLALREAVGVDNVHTDEEFIEQASAQLGYPTTLAHLAVVPEHVGTLLMSALELATNATCDRIYEQLGEDA